MSDFEKNIQLWVLLDNKIKNLSNEINNLKNKKTIINDNIFTFVRSNNLTNSVINISDGELNFGTTKQTSGITLKNIENILNETLNDKTQVDIIMNKIKNNKNTKIINTIKRIKKN